MVYSTQKVYRISKHEGVNNLAITDADVPKPKRGQVLVKIHATSLNYRDLMVVKGFYPPPYASGGLIPVSDGAGEVVEVGEDVTDFKVGDRVCGTFHQKWTDGAAQKEYLTETLGGSVQGVLAQYRAFDQTGVIKFPSFLSYEEASTLPCAALTAWNALAHNGTQAIGPDQTVLILGTGGVSIFGIQFAAAAGARVIVTSSSDEKLEKARSLGATDFINYSKNPNWEEKVLELTGGKGVDHVIEVGGSGTLPRSIKSARVGGQVHMIGVLTQNDSSVDIGPLLLFGAITVRGLLVGSRAMFESMNKAIDHNKIHPVIDKVFEFDQAQEAYKYLESQKHVGKIVIRVD